MWRAVDIDLFMKRWILLMKYDEVKTQKQNYLVFLRNGLSAEIFLVSSRQDPLFFTLTCPMPDSSAQLIFSEHLTEISRAYGDTYFPTRTDHICQPLGLNLKIPPSHGPESWEGIQ